VSLIVRVAYTTSALILWQLDIRFYFVLVSWIFVCVFIVSSCRLVANKLENIYYLYNLCLNEVVCKLHAFCA